jgi:hypothetical protein
MVGRRVLGIIAGCVSLHKVTTERKVERRSQHELTRQVCPPGAADFASKASRSPEGYRRDRTTWAAFGALFAFGFLNALLGPALPYIRTVERISYLVGALHQLAFALGGGRDRRS